MSEIQFKGLAELQRALDSLPAKIENNILRGGMRAALKVIEKDAKQRVSAYSGELRDTIRSGVKPSKKTGKLVGYVKAGPKAGTKRTPGNNDGWYVHLVERGTAAHLIRARPPNKMLAIGVVEVMHPGSRKKPFMRPALDTRAAEAVEVMREYIRKRLSTKHGIDVPDPDLEDDGEE